MDGRRVRRITRRRTARWPRWLRRWPTRREPFCRRLAETILEVFRCDSAGISLLTTDDGGKRFHWPAIAGLWKPHIGGGTPRDFGPCGDVLDRNAPLLFRHFERRYTYFLPVTPPVEECLLVPFYVEGKAVGTIWAIAHDDRRTFDAEDMRQLVSLGNFASAAYQAVAFSDALEQQVTELQEASAQLREANERLVVGSVHAHTMTDDAEEANHLKDEFLATVSHELRTPLNALLGWASMLGSKQLPLDREGHAIAAIERNASTLAHLIDDLLDVSRIVAGTFRLAPQAVDLVAVVQAALDVVRPLAVTKNVQLAFSPDLPAIKTVSGDAGRLQQVILNLLTNAIKFTPEGGRVDVFIERSNDHMEVRVVDTGDGISPDFLPHVFERFRQADGATTRRHAGLGLGLAIVRQLVELHSGTVYQPVRAWGAARRSPSVCRLQPARLREVKRVRSESDGPRLRRPRPCRAYRGSMVCASWSSMTAPTGAR